MYRALIQIFATLNAGLVTQLRGRLRRVEVSGGFGCRLIHGVKIPESEESFLNSGSNGLRCIDLRMERDCRYSKCAYFAAFVVIEIASGNEIALVGLIQRLSIRLDPCCVFLCCYLSLVAWELELGTVTSTPASRKRSWKVWLLAFFLIFALTAFSSWQYIKHSAKRQVLGQLAELDLGVPEIGRISVGLTGVTARDIEFVRDGQTWLTLGELIVKHPTIELVQGTERFNELELVDAVATVHWDESFEEGEAFEFENLGKFSLPAERMRFSNATLVLKSKRRPEFEIGQIDLLIDQNASTDLPDHERSIKFKGEVGCLCGGEWNLQGCVDSQNQLKDVWLTTKSLELNTDQWKAWPFLPQGMDEAVTVDGQLSLSLSASTGPRGVIQFDGAGTIAEVAVGLPQFNLPIQIHSSDFTIARDKLSFSKIEALVDDEGKLDGNVEVGFAEFPVSTRFDSTFDGIPIKTWRKLAAAIPQELSGLSTGTANGVVLVDSSTRTTLEISALAQAEQCKYGKLIGEKVDVEVDVTQLVFDRQQEYESIEGGIGIEAEFLEQPIDNAFRTFALNSLQSSLQMVGDSSAQLQMNLPLATAEDLSTWELSVKSQIPTGAISGQSISDLTATVFLNEGVLEFQPIEFSPNAKVKAGSVLPIPMEGVNEKVSVRIRWPLVEQELLPQKGTISIAGKSVAAAWLNQLARNQWGENAAESIVGGELSGWNPLSGHVDFESDLQIPIDEPESWSSWELSVSVHDTQLQVDGFQLNDFASEIRIKDGTLNLEDVRGNFSSGGTIDGRGMFSLDQSSGYEFQANAVDVPLRWMVTTAMGTIPRVREFVEERDLAHLVDGDELSGELSLQLSCGQSEGQDSLPQIEISVLSDQLTFGGSMIRSVELVAGASSQEIRIDKLVGKVGSKGNLDARGNWEFESGEGTGIAEWQDIPADWIANLIPELPNRVEGFTRGRLEVSSGVKADANDANRIHLSGLIGFEKLVWNRLKLKDFEVDLFLRNDRLCLENFRTVEAAKGLELVGALELASPFKFELSSELKNLQLAQIIERSSVIDSGAGTLELTGILNGQFSLTGELEGDQWTTAGEVNWANPTWNRKRISNIQVGWNHQSDDWKRLKLEVQAFGGSVRVIEISEDSEAIRIQLDGIDGEQFTSVMGLPSEFSGRLDGKASLNQWSQVESCWADLHLVSTSVLWAGTEFGDFHLNADYRNLQLSYDIDGAILGGKMEAKGETVLDQNDLASTKFPLQLRLTNASLNGLYRSSKTFRNFRWLTGSLLAEADLELGLDGQIVADGRVGVAEVNWNRELLTREASVHFRLTDRSIVFDDLRADLNRGSIAARAELPISGESRGSYEVEIRDLDLNRLAEIFDIPIDAEGLLDARINGQIGREVTGQGFVGVHRARINGVAAQSFRLPVQYQLNPVEGSGKLELRRSTFRMFDGNASGEATFSYGNGLNLDVDLRVSNVDTEKVIATIADINRADQGKLTGRLRLRGKNVRSVRDLEGSFRGNLERATVFKLPVLNDVARVVAGGNLLTGDYASDEIILLLDNNRLNVEQLNFTSSLVKIAITGSAFLDGRMDLNAAVRVERFQQPTLLDELAGSPLLRLSGSTTAFFAQAAEFLSERVVFLRIVGTFKRPQVRIDTGRQLREETIRYFLRDLQISPYGVGRNN